MPELPPAPSPPGVGASPPALSVASLRSALAAWLGDTRGTVAWRRLAGSLGAVLAVVVLGVVAWRAFVAGGSGAGPPPELTLPRAAPGAGPSSGSAEPSTAAGGRASPTVLVVHVAGAVTRPGVYRLGGAPRVADAIDAAGGPAPDADLDALNLAAMVTDGERVYLPRRGEAPPPQAGGAGVGAAATGPLDLNTATAEQLDALPGVGPSTAAAILSYRQEHGRFRSVDELLEVRGIGEAKLADLRSKVRVR